MQTRYHPGLLPMSENAKAKNQPKLLPEFN